MPIPKKTFATTQVEKYWKILFHEPLRQETEQKLIKFAKFGGGMIIAKLVSVTTQIIMGRKLGPLVYGQCTIILLLASYFALPIVNGWGLVFTKISAKKNENKVRLQALKSLLFIVATCSILTTLTLLVLQKPLAEWLNIDHQTMKLTIVMTLFYSWWILSKQIAQGLQNWYLYIIIENSWAWIVLIGILGSIFMLRISLVTVCFVFFAGYFIAGLFTCRSIWQSFFVKLNTLLTWDILSHGYFLLISSLVGMAAFSIDRVLINTSLGALDVGIYQAHFLATYGIISAFMTILLTYIFPAFCSDDTNNIHSLIQRLNKLQYPITIFISIFIGGTVLWLYTYPVSLLLFACLCIFNGVQFHAQIKTWYISSKGASATKFALKSQVVFLVTNVITLLLLLPLLGINAGGVSLLFAACSSLFYLTRAEDEIFHERTL